MWNELSPPHCLTQHNQEAAPLNSLAALAVSPVHHGKAACTDWGTVFTASKPGEGKLILFSGA